MKKQGFTLVELLVVITIIGMLISMLLPAVQQAREAARRAQCSNRQKQLSTALLNYESAKKRLPGYVGGMQCQSLTATFPSGRAPASWFMQILSYMERSDLADIWANEQPFAVTSDNTYMGYVFIKPLTCPSDPPPSSGSGETHLSYRVNCGYRDELLGTATSTENGDPSAAYGVFQNNFNSTTQVTSSLEYISSHDGTSQTMLLSEGKLDVIPANYVASRWVLPYAKKTGTGFPGLAGTMQVVEKSLGLTVPPIDPDTGSSVAYTAATPGTGINRYVGMPSSYHPGLVIAAFCDGHVTTLSDEMDQTVYLHVITPFGKRAFEENVDPSPNYGMSWYSGFNPAVVGVLDDTQIE